MDHEGYMFNLVDSLCYLAIVDLLAGCFAGYAE